MEALTLTPEQTSTQQWDELSIPHSVLSRVPFNLAIEYFILPISSNEHGRIEALMAYPHDAALLQTVQMALGTIIKPVPCAKELLLKLINKHYGPSRNVAATESAASIINDTPRRKRFAYVPTDSTTVLVNNLFHEAIRLRASDIHLEPFERDMTVRFRVDGVLQEITSIPLLRIAEVTSRVKVLSGMDIAIKRRPQDGRIRISEHGRDVDIRVSTLPTDFGEKVVLRLLDKGGFNYNLDTIGLDAARLSLIKRSLQMPNGIILITGPTGSGKTTTLYAGLSFLKKPDINISTVEDPIEYNIPGVSQTQVNTLSGMTFAHTLRTLLRQDPDVIMVGEMRDTETAEIAVRSSLTGHLVLSTLHTNDAPSAVTRLIDMGVESYLVASSLSCVVAQRLVRKICKHCSCEDIDKKDIKQRLGLSHDFPVFKGLGCSECGYTGYSGRIGIYEVLPISDTLRKLITEKAFIADIRSKAIEEGMVPLRDDALVKLRDGITSLDEVVREVAVLS